MNKLKPRGRGDSHVFDYSKVADHLYIGSDLCKGKSCPVHSKEFNSLGVTVELNLSAEKKETPPDEIESYLWIPVVDGYAPTQKQFNIGSAAINEAVESGETVYVHCKNGHGRSPTMVVSYLIRYKNMEVAKAIDYISKRRPEIHIEDIQKKALEKFYEKWSK